MFSTTRQIWRITSYIGTYYLETLVFGAFFSDGGLRRKFNVIIYGCRSKKRGKTDVCVSIYVFVFFFRSKDEPEVNSGEVDEYLLCAIDARSIDRLKSQYCYPITLKFRDSNIEQIVSISAMYRYNCGIQSIHRIKFIVQQFIIDHSLFIVVYFS